MARKKPKTVNYRRKRELKTDYKKRLKLLFSNKPRLVVRLSNQRIIAQIVEFHSKGDLVKVEANSSYLKNLGWSYSFKNTSAAYLTGLLIAKKAIKSGYREAIMDTGFFTVLKGSRIFAFLRGALDGGLSIPHGEDKAIFPSDERISGKHIKDYFAIHSKEPGSRQTQRFTKYLKNNAQPDKIDVKFSEIKHKIMSLN